MNIFWLDITPELIAQAHCDKHVVKMCLEYAQLLSGVVRIIAPELCSPEFPYKLTHKNHPCAIWARDSRVNYEFLYRIAIALGDEYTYRYGKVHKSITLVKNLPQITFLTSGTMDIPRCMPDQYKNKNLILAYRNYYKQEKAYFAKWTKRAPPDWWNK
jgi:hypothetical protein